MESFSIFPSGTRSDENIAFKRGAATVALHGTTANHRRLFFRLREAKSKIFALDGGDMHPDQVKLIAKRLGVTEHAVIDMNRRLGMGSFE